MPLIATAIPLLIYFIAISAVLLLSASLGVVTYVLQSLALWRMASSCRLPRPWLAWVPCADLWVLGALADHHNAENRDKKTYTRWILLAGELLMLALTLCALAIILLSVVAFVILTAAGIPIAGAVVYLVALCLVFAVVLLLLPVSTAHAVFLVLALWRVHTLFASDTVMLPFWITAGIHILSRTVMSSLSTYVGIVQAVCLFLISKRTPIYRDSI